MKRTYIAKRRILPLLVCLILISVCRVPSPALSESAVSYTLGIRLFPVGMAGFTTEATLVYQRGNTNSPSIPLPAGFPVTVVGASGPFWCVENASGACGYIPQDKLSPIAPATENPVLHGYDPCWERESCLLMLPKGISVYDSASIFARSMKITADTPCRILGKQGKYLIVGNMEGTAVACVWTEDLAPVLPEPNTPVSWAVSAAG